MELQPKLHAAADMCESGTEVNLDEIAFLLRYAADELAQRPDAARERDHLVERMRTRLLARCGLLERSENDLQRAREGSLAQLEQLEAEIDHSLRSRLQPYGPPEDGSRADTSALPDGMRTKFASGR